MEGISPVDLLRLGDAFDVQFHYHRLLPAIWVSVLSILLSDEHSLFRSQVENRAASPAHRRPS